MALFSWLNIKIINDTMFQLVIGSRERVHLYVNQYISLLLVHKHNVTDFKLPIEIPPVFFLFGGAV
jgi:hypothetical protein